MAVRVEREVWFGTREFMQWVPAWATGPTYGAAGSVSESTYLNGGAHVRQSLSAARTYDLAWNPMSRERLRSITDFADGVYGSGLIYWSEPTAQDVNVLPQRWATPWLATEDANPLIKSARPEVVSTPSLAQRYPPYGARYTKQAGDTSASIFIPIPPGRTAWVGVHGSGAGAAGVVRVRTFERMTVGASVRPTVLAADSTTRVNYSVNGVGQTWIELSLDLASIANGATFDLYGLIVQVLPTGLTPAQGGFLSGQGHSGCRWSKRPALTPYSVPNESVGMSGALTEVGSWL